MHDMSWARQEAADTRRKRLYFRCWRRGTKELDLLLGRFAERHLAQLSDEQVGRMERLLECADHDLYNWITGKQDAPRDHDHDVMVLLRNISIDP